MFLKLQDLFAGIPDAALSLDFQEWQGRIVGGQTAIPGQFPYQASVRGMDNRHFCGGYVINSRWVGSAAHCTITHNGANTIVVLGAQNRVVGGITHSVSRIVNHPNYVAITLFNDISLIQTVNEIIVTATVRPIPLGSAFISGGAAVISGWGQTSNPGSHADELQFINVNVITNENCRSRLSMSNAMRIFNSTICTLPPVGKGVCIGKVSNKSSKQSFIEFVFCNFAGDSGAFKNHFEFYYKL